MAHAGTLTLALFTSLVVFAGCSSSRTAPDSGVDAGADGTVRDSSTPDSSRPDSSPPDGSTPACTGTTSHFEPGCGEPGDPYVEITAGCYDTCDGESDDTCGDDLSCQRALHNPCICEPGMACCGACGAEVWLCLPPPAPCEGRSYCDCNSVCEPLVDLTTGCICPCDDPFNCTGETCDCACGGATYLGCAPMGRCEETEVHCGACDVVMVDGCPACDPACAP